MTQIQRSILIDAPADTIFTILVDPQKANLMNPYVTVKAHRFTEIGAPILEYEYKMAGMGFSGDTKPIVYEPPSHFVAESMGGLESRWDWHLKPISEGRTLISVDLEYTPPLSIIGAVMDKLVLEKQNEKIIEEQLESLKRLAEEVVASKA
jgi:hypothetical protein